MGLVFTQAAMQAPTGTSLLLLDWPLAPYGKADVEFTVRIAVTEASDHGFTFATQDSGSGAGFAIAGTDYTATSGSGTISAGNLYTQINVVFVNAAPTDPPGTLEFEMVVTDDVTGGITTTKGLIIQGIHWMDFDYPTGVSQKKNFYQPDQTGGWSESNLVAIGGASIGEEVPPAVGIQALKQDVETSTGAQNIVGVDTLATINAGDIFDGLEYYYKWHMKIKSGFIWTGGNQQKMKAGRHSRIVGGVLFTTIFITGSRIRWEWSYPVGGGSDTNSVKILQDWAGIDDDWHEYIWYQKRQTAYETADGESRFVIDGVLEDTQLLVEWTEAGQTEPGDATTVRATNQAGLTGFFQNQIGNNGETTGGVIYTDGHVCTKGIWPSARYAKPW